MAALFNKTRNFSRSHSSVNISDSTRTSSKHDTELQNGHPSLPRSSSYASSLNDFRSSISSTATDTSFAPRDTFKSPLPTTASERKAEDRIRAMEAELQRSHGKDVRPKVDNSGKRRSFANFMSKVRGAPDKPASSQPRSHQEIVSLPKARTTKPKTPAESPMPTRRKSWLGVSRSPSPSRTVTTDDSYRDDVSTVASSVSSISVREPSPSKTDGGIDAGSRRSQSPGTAKARKSAQYTRAREEIPPPIPSSTAPSIRSFRSQASSGPNKSRSSLALQQDAAAKVSYKDKLVSMGLDSNKKKDGLWSVFRQLETDYQKFADTSSTLRVNVLRKTLLPFLRSHRDHPANKTPRIEDLDRRIEVLDKWWGGLLDLLDGNSGRYVSGGDRPAVLDALNGIMSRPEWRLAPSDLATYADQIHYDTQSAATYLGESATSRDRAEAVYESVKATFVKNLLQQVGIVVDKMSLKAAPASLINFCGKAVAYAFFFCPGVADVLVKIWAIQAETLRRIAEAYNLPQRPRRGRLDNISEGFPLTIQPLGWTSTRTMISKLRSPTALPVDAAQVKWHGAWTSRWAGRDTDLFFVFCKQYHILLEEFIPPNTSLNEKARAPCFMLVQCQLLAALQATIHRQAIGEAAAAAGLPPVTFDELLKGTDATADALPLPPSTNVQRMMAENRLISLLRDFLAETTPEHDVARRTFAVAFKKIMYATAIRTSQFDHAACFTLCDFMEEALAIYIKFESAESNDESCIEWRFWLDVCQKMLDSQNTMTELRVLSLIYSSWNTITADDKRKEYMCLEWLVSRKIFQAYFLHWCPMVRAYYMRLLAWRLCRFTGEASKLDTKIMAALFVELKHIWGTYIYLRNTALEQNTQAPSAAACLPAPNRRLLIIRVDTQAAAANLMLGLDASGQKAASSTTMPTRTSGTSTNSKLPDLPAEHKDSPRNRWQTNRNKSSSSLNTSATTSSPVKKSSASDNHAHDKARMDASTRGRPPLHKRSISASSVEPGLATPMPYTKYSFKFSLEWSAGPSSYTHTAFHADVSAPASPSLSSSKLLSSHRGSHSNLDDLQTSYSKERKLSPPRLPSTCHSWLVSKVPGSSGDEIMPIKPAPGAFASAAKYSGRALAEWLLIVTENNNFVHRRISEGVPNMKAIEVPVLGVEGFRKFL